MPIFITNIEGSSTSNKGSPENKNITCIGEENMTGM